MAQDTSTNIFLAAFTTAWARLKLYGEMDKLGRNVLYHDTDSIVYTSDGMNDPPLGNFLGEFTDELDGDTIVTFVSGKFCFSKNTFLVSYIFVVDSIFFFYLFQVDPKTTGTKPAQGKRAAKSEDLL